MYFIARLKTLHLITLFLVICCFFQNSTPLNAEESIAEQISRDFTNVAKRAIPAVVSIKSKFDKGGNDERSAEQNDDFYYDPFGGDLFQQFFQRYSKKPQTPQPVIGQGSGFLVSNDGYILTNSHVVQNSSEILVTLNDGREINAKIVGLDPNTDVAVIKIEENALPYIEFDNSDDLEIGQWVIAIGNTLGLEASLTVGVVSAKGRNNLDLANIEDFIQTDAAINRGNSGGPLLDLDSKVVGMNTAIVTSMSGGGYMGIGFAIPSNILKHVMEQLMKTGKVERGFIGVALQAIDKDLAQAFGLQYPGKGALIAEVTRGSPAEKAGLMQGDVIQSYNNHAVHNIGTLRNAIALMTPGTKINLTVLRQGKTLEIPIVVGNYPQSTPKVAATSGNKLGFEVQDLTPELAKSLGINEQSGVIISKIESGSAAAWAGLVKGTLIVAVNHKNVTNVDQFNAALAEIPKGKPVLLLVKQGDVVRYLSLKTS